MSSTWFQYGREDRQSAAEQLLQLYQPLIDFQVGRLLFDLPASVDREDLVSEARIGLLDAINRFDPAKQVKFETYASIRIKGAIVDYLRKLDWAPRSLRAKAREFAQAEAELEQELGAPPEEPQLAARLGLSMEQYRSALGEMSALTVLSFREMEDGEAGELSLKDEQEEPALEVLRAGFARNLAQAIDRLSERDRLILDLYYRRQLSLKEIGAVLSLSESRICQIHSAVVIKLREQLRGWQDEV
jgi:RNA polymerase sigma factor for flagellar operon FliA